MQTKEALIEKCAQLNIKYLECAEEFRKATNTPDYAIPEPYQDAQVWQRKILGDLIVLNLDFPEKSEKPEAFINDYFVLKINILILRAKVGLALTMDSEKLLIPALELFINNPKIQFKGKIDFQAELIYCFNKSMEKYASKAIKHLPKFQEFIRNFDPSLTTLQFYSDYSKAMSVNTRDRHNIQGIYKALEEDYKKGAKGIEDKLILIEVKIIFYKYDINKNTTMEKECFPLIDSTLVEGIQLIATINLDELQKMPHQYERFKSLLVKLNDIYSTFIDLLVDELADSSLSRKLFISETTETHLKIFLKLKLVQDSFQMKCDPSCKIPLKITKIDVDIGTYLQALAKNIKELQQELALKEQKDAQDRQNAINTLVNGKKKRKQPVKKADQTKYNPQLFPAKKKEEKTSKEDTKKPAIPEVITEYIKKGEDSFQKKEYLKAAEHLAFAKTYACFYSNIEVQLSCYDRYLIYYVHYLDKTLAHLDYLLTQRLKYKHSPFSAEAQQWIGFVLNTMEDHLKSLCENYNAYCKLMDQFNPNDPAIKEGLTFSKNEIHEQIEILHTTNGDLQKGYEDTAIMIFENRKQFLIELGSRKVEEKSSDGSIYTEQELLEFGLEEFKKIGEKKFIEGKYPSLYSGEHKLFRVFENTGKSCLVLTEELLESTKKPQKSGMKP